MKRQSSRSWSVLSVVLLLSVLSACATLPPEPPTEDAYALPSPKTGLLAEAIANIRPKLEQAESAFRLLPRAGDSLAWRIALIDSAERSIDAQYFVWHDDAVGAMLLERLYMAADRGVKVRLLVDDMHLAAHSTFAGNDKELAAVDHHPNLEFRLFNPGYYRDGTVGVLASMVNNAQHYNRRMHNKLLVVDNHFAVVGGRNIGDEYFGIDKHFNFVDLDLLVTGAVLPQLSESFDEYWNSEFPYPARALAHIEEQDFEAVRQENRAYAEVHSHKLDTFYELSEDKKQQLADPRPMFERGIANFYRDEPIQREKSENRLYEVLSEALEAGYAEAVMSTPYLIPARNFLTLLGKDIEAGATVRILTNSLATNNQPVVHAHYKNYRRTLLEMGVELHELHHQPAAEVRQLADTPPVEAEFIALHMKASVIDGERCFVGTMNIDPRSLDINTEDVLDITSPGLCKQLRDYLIMVLKPVSSWRVTQNEDGQLRWMSYEGAVDVQPVREDSQRLWDKIYQILPEDQL